MKTRSWRLMALFAMVLTTFGLVACGEEEEEVALKWVEQPLPEQVFGTEAPTYSWQVTGPEDTDVEHTNIHACPAEDPACTPMDKGGTRHDGEVLIGVAPSTYPQQFALPPGEWLVKAHARVNGKDHFVEYEQATSIKVSGVGFDMPAKPFGVDDGVALPAGQEIPVAFRAYPEASGAEVQLCPAGATDPATECTTVAATAGTGSLFTAAVTPATAGEYTVQISATVAGTLETFQETITVE